MGGGGGGGVRYCHYGICVCASPCLCFVCEVVQFLAPRKSKAVSFAVKCGVVD